MFKCREGYAILSIPSGFKLFFTDYEPFLPFDTVIIHQEYDFRTLDMVHVIHSKEIPTVTSIGCEFPYLSVEYDLKTKKPTGIFIEGETPWKMKKDNQER